jgi:putative SOS response-associated peptidase YedK
VPGKFPPKQPFYIFREDRRSLSMAGIWSTWVSPIGERIDSVVIITQDGVGIVALICTRMPVILPEDCWDLWLDPTRHDVAELRALLEFSRPDKGLTLHAVSLSVNSVANNSPAMIAPISLGEPETLF